MNNPVSVYCAGELPALYSGTNAEFTKADTVIFRYFATMRLSLGINNLRRIPSGLTCMI